MAYQVGDVYAWRGEKDKAFEWLERAYQQRDSGLNGIAYDPADRARGSRLIKIKLLSAKHQSRLPIWGSLTLSKPFSRWPA